MIKANKEYDRCSWCTITEEETLKWVDLGTLVSYFAWVLNGTYDLDEAREDVLSFRTDGCDG